MVVCVGIIRLHPKVCLFPGSDSTASCIFTSSPLTSVNTKRRRRCQIGMVLYRSAGIAPLVFGACGLSGSRRSCLPV